MPDYGHDLRFGAFITPSAEDADLTVARAAFAEQVGFDLVTFQDHPYQAKFLDTWTLLAYVGARTERVTVSANVLNLPLRQPAVIARSAASLDLLTGGRVELGLGAGAFWDAIEANGGRRLTGGQAVDALEEAIHVIREVWAADEAGGVRVDGEYYRVVGAKRGPAPAHDIGIWLGAYKPRMLALVGRAADGWVPSLGRLPGGPSDLDGMNEIIDEAAVMAGREPTDVRRLLNIGTDLDAEQIAAIALEYGTSTFILASDEPTALQRFAAEIAPEVRAFVVAERQAPVSDVSSVGPHETSDTVPVTANRVEGTVPEALAGIATVDDGVRLSARKVWDESSRPVAPAPPADHVYDERATYVSKHLVDVHDHLRQELQTVRGLVEQVKAGALAVGDARSAINEMTMRQNDWTLGAYCASYCRVVTGHHSLEDAEVFPHLRRADPGLAPVIDRLHEEHLVIHDVLEEVDAALVAFVADPHDFTGLEDALNLLSDALLSHLAYEEQQIVEPLARLGFYAGQLLRPVYEPGRSAIVVPVADAEPAVGTWRDRYDASAPFGMPAHITVLYPFLPEDRLTEDVVDRLKEICADSHVMAVELRETRRFPGMLYLAPEPDGGFRRLTEAVVEEWPEAPPYGGAHDDNIPHLTVAHDLGDTTLDEVDRAVTADLPIRTRLTSASLYVFDGARWRIRDVLPFRPTIGLSGVAVERS